MKRVVLASQSPRRRELLASIGLNFMTKAVPTQEVWNDTLPIGKAVEQIAYEKAKAVQDLLPNDIILSADTVVCLNDQVLGKPKNEEEAYAMIQMLSGKTHTVITAVCILKEEQKEVFHECSEVTFFELSEEEIQSYVKTKEGLDKAGAYGIQGLGKILVEKINGDYYNIVGLPIAKTYRLLKKFM